ncbi:hypothetical protein RA19_24820 [Leisingera sp. ANG-M1]|nr:hypothetical protein RA19_24820 [Leisingera sp. ANG-M1]
MTRCALALCLCAALTAGTEFAVSAQTLPEAIALHNSAAAGDAKDLDAAVSMLEALSEADPENAEIVAYLGSAYAITAREGRNVVSKMRNTNKALRHLDQALEMEPDNFSVRMVRASVQRNLPPMFNRADDAVEDMVVLDRLFQATDKAPRSMAEAMLSIYDHLLAHAASRGDWAAGRDIALDRSK